MRPIRLVIADRRPIVLQGFASLFAAERDFEIVASCIDGAGCLEAVRNLTPDVVLVEDGFSDVTASEMLAVVNAENRLTRLVFYTASVARGDLAAAIAAGACSAISMREKPETLLKSLRLVAPTPDRAAAGNEESDAVGENGVAALTDRERKIMRLVAYGMSNKEIARQLKVSPGTVKAHLDHISTQLEIKNRTELAAFALSRLYGGIGALAALIFAALDDVQAASTTAVGHTSTDTFTVIAADGTAEVVTIKINLQKTAAALGKTAKAVIKASGRAENSVADTPARTGKFIESSVDIAANTITLLGFNFPRPGLGSYGTFMMTVIGVWVYELLNSAAQAFNLRDSITSVFASATADGTKELVALNIPGSADAKLDGLDNLAWLNPEIYHQSFAFEALRSGTIARSGDELQIIDAAVREDSVSRNGDPHAGSGAIDALIDHGGFEQATATDASRNAEHGTIQATGGDDSTHGQSQRDLHASEDGGPAGRQHAKHDPPGVDPTHGQSRSDLHTSEGGGPASKQHAKHDPPGNDSTHGQSQRDLHAPENGSSGADQHAKHDATPGSDAKPDQSQRDLNTAPVNASNSSHLESKLNAEGKDQALDHAGLAETAAASELGDSFHFKNEMAASKASDSSEIHVSHRPDFLERGPHTAGHEEQAPIQDSDPIGFSHIVDHAKGAEHHLTHDLIV